jgi:diguanylate cyclase (GGDEF)-like protein
MPGQDTVISKKVAEDISKALYGHSDKHRLPDIFRIGIRNLLLKRVGFVKLRFDKNIGKFGDIIPEAIAPEDIVVDKDAVWGSVPRFIAQNVKDKTGEELISMFPEAKDNAILGRGSADIIIKEEELLLLKESQEFKHSSLTDALTGIMNRRAILDELSKRMNRHIYNFKHLSIIMIDIDDFKLINDKFGHLMGDKVLVEIAQKINEVIRGFDTVGRYGGEEFLVILPNTDLDNAYKASERIRLNIEKTLFENVGEITISAGYVEYKNESMDELIDLADQNLYKAKNAGKNRVYGNLQK